MYTATRNEISAMVWKLLKDYGARELLRIELVNITPALVGSWNGTRYANLDKYYVEPPRPTDITGKTRWWLRAILAGGLYDLYGIHAPINALDELASKIMGYVSRRRSMASKIVIVAEASSNQFAFPGCCKADHAERGERVLIDEISDCGPKCPRACCGLALLSPRVAMMVSRKVVLGENVPLPPCFYKFRLRVIERPGASLSEPEESLIGYALGLATFVTGIGRMTSRGYGKLAPITVPDNLGSDGNSLSEAFMNVLHALRSSKKPLKNIANEAVEAARDYVNQLGNAVRTLVQDLRIKYRKLRAPITETLHKDFIHESCINPDRARLRLSHVRHDRCCGEIKNPGLRPWCLVAAITSAVMAKNIGKDAPLHVLGLPRRIKKKRFMLVFRKGGKSEGRLLSQIQFTVIGECNKDKHIPALHNLIIYGFDSVLTDVRELIKLDRSYLVKHLGTQNVEGLLNKFCNSSAKVGVREVVKRRALCYVDLDRFLERIVDRLIHR